MDTYQAWHSGKLFELGSGHVVICRKRGGGMVQAAVMLVDVFCLGVRDAFLTEESQSDFEELRERIGERDPLVVCSPAYARKLIDESIAYAGQFGFAPHRDYRKVKKVLNRIDPGECGEEIPMGKEGKPFYIQSPSHNEAFTNRVLSALERKLGEGGFEYILVGGADDEDWYDDEEEVPYILISEYPRGSSPETEKLSLKFKDDLYEMLEMDIDLWTDEKSPAFAEVLAGGAESNYHMMKKELGEDACKMTLSEFIDTSIFQVYLTLLPEDERNEFFEGLEKKNPENTAYLRKLLLEEDEKLDLIGLDPSVHTGRFLHWQVTPPQTPANPGDRPHILIACVLGPSRQTPKLLPPEFHSSTQSLNQLREWC